MDLMQYSSSARYLKDRIESLPNKGRGEMAKIAEHLGVHSTLISFIASEKRFLSLEQGMDLAEYWGLGTQEIEYWMVLIESERAGNVKLKSYFSEKLKDIRKRHQHLPSRMKSAKSLNEKNSGIFYSNWLYSAIRLFCSTAKNGKSLEDIQLEFDLNRDTSLGMVEFLTSNELLLKEKGLYLMGTQRTSVGANSPYVRNHLSNWRMRSLNRLDRITNEELMVSSPFSISKSDFSKLKQMLLDFVENSSEIIRESPADDVACFNLDLFWAGRK